jgi:CRISPR-associated protein Cas2
MHSRSFFLLTYDMRDDRRRNRIARLMESLGERVQGSVFEAYLTPDELQKIFTKSQKIMKLQEDSLRVYTICEACRPRLKTLGQGKPTPPPESAIVL